jgi:hypothetical protein
MLVVRVETDWYAHQTEFRYVLQPGEGAGGLRNAAGRRLVVHEQEAGVAERHGLETLVCAILFR